MQTHIKKIGQDTQFVECVGLGTITQKQAPYTFVISSIRFSCVSQQIWYPNI